MFWQCFRDMFVMVYCEIISKFTPCVLGKLCATAIIAAVVYAVVIALVYLYASMYSVK